MVGRKNTDARIRRGFCCAGPETIPRRGCSTLAAAPGHALHRRIRTHAEAGRGGLLRQALAYFRDDAGFAGI